MATGVMPFPDPNDPTFVERVRAGDYDMSLLEDSLVSGELRDFIGRALDPDQFTRVRARDLLEHPFVRLDRSQRVMEMTEALMFEPNDGYGL